ncbi:MAG: metallophosphoesterase, partial [Kiritimatiellaeota bacterium]|nr:metallophosphoesterase [Kiritimatiellota bacterium]
MIITFVLAAMIAAGTYLWNVLLQLLWQAFGGRHRCIAFATSGAAVIGMVMTQATWGLVFYLVLFCAVGDIIGNVATASRRRRTAFVMAGVVLAVGVCIYGYFHARDIRVTHYDITIAKRAGDLRTLRAVLMTDMHLGATIGAAELDAIVRRVNALSPDIVLLGGDLYDDKTPPALFEHSLAAWRALNAPRGIYFVGGNHERASYSGRRIATALPRLME